MTPKLKFAEGEKVLCFHGPLIYEAKALKFAISKDKQVKYYIHYAGWNKNWDEWVPESRVLKYNEMNVQKQKDLFKMHSNNLSVKKPKATSKGKKSDSASAKDGGFSSGGSESRASTPSKDLNTSQGVVSNNRGNRTKFSSNATKETDGKREESSKEEGEVREEIMKKKRGSSASSTSDKSHTTTANTSISTNDEDTLLTRNEVKIKIPDELKQCLADDWDAITRQHKLFDIPAKLTVQDILDEYVSYRKLNKGPCKEIVIIDILNGVTEYFNVMLGSQLLYKFERPQYAEMLSKHPDKPPSKLYGSIHLLRLFVKLGSMLAYSSLDEQTLQALLNHLNDFMKYLAKNIPTYFNMASYVNCTPEYHRNTQ